MKASFWWVRYQTLNRSLGQERFLPIPGWGHLALGGRLQIFIFFFFLIKMLAVWCYPCAWNVRVNPGGGGGWLCGPSTVWSTQRCLINLIDHKNSTGLSAEPAFCCACILCCFYNSAIQLFFLRSTYCSVDFMWSIYFAKMQYFERHNTFDCRAFREKHGAEQWHQGGGLLQTWVKQNCFDFNETFAKLQDWCPFRTLHAQLFL